MCERARSRLNVLKSLAGSTWGQQKETLLITYKALIKSVLSYAAPIWFPNASQTAIAKIQTIQNSALRIATGSHKMASASHLHCETEVLPVSSSLSLLCQQFLASALRPHHPSFPLVTQSSGPRSMKHTLQSRFLPSIVHHLVDGSLPPDSYSSTLKTLHSEAVSSAIGSADHNTVLRAPPPAICPSEKLLPRPTRATLSQLRSGHCASLRSYQARVGLAPDPRCPECNRSEHTVQHLFDCAAHPTSLAAADLWTNPLGAALFLSSLPSFSQVQPPPTRPPPEPPPPAGQA